MNRYRIAARDDRGAWTIRAAQLDRDDPDELRDDYDTILEPVLELHRRGLTTVASDFAGQLTSRGAPYALLATVAFRDAGLIP